jgi:hypothetical protein
MSRLRKLGTIAALGGIVLAFAMTAGARADELSELRANQELLQQRLDQLSQAFPGSVPAAGTPVTSGAFPRSFLIPGTDTSLRIGGFAQANVNYWLNGVAPDGILFGAGGNTQTCPESNGATCELPAIPLDLHGQNIAGNIQGTASPAHSRGTYFQIDGRLTQFSFDAQTPTPWGVARAYIEMDFAASNAGNGTTYSNLTNVSSGWIPRIRQGYASLGGFLAGQRNGGWRDTDSEGECVEGGCDEGYGGRTREPGVQYTWTGLPWGMSFKLAADNPVGTGVGPAGAINEDTNPVPTIAACPTSVATGVTSITIACLGSGGEFNPLQNTMPDWIGVWRMDQPWGHVQLGGALSETTLNDGKFLNQNILGYGGYLSGDIKPFYDHAGVSWAKDDLGWGFGAGDGIGGLIADCQAVATNYGAGATLPTSTFTTNRALYDSGVVSKSIHCYGTHIDLVHWWTDEWRTNLNWSMVHQDVSSLLISGNNCITTGGVGPLAAANNCGAGGSASGNKELMIGHANLYWSPVTWVDIGIEYAWGHRVTIGNLKGDENSINGRMKVKF